MIASLGFNFGAHRLSMAIDGSLPTLLGFFLVWLVFSSILIVSKHFFVAFDIFFDNFGEPLFEEGIVGLNPLRQLINFGQLLCNLFVALIVEQLDD